MTTTPEVSHLIQILSRGFGCSCGHNRTDATTHHEAVRLASQHQLAAFVRGVASEQFVVTTCLGCSGKLRMPESNSEGLMHDYAVWIGQACPRCGRAPREIAADA